MTDGYAGVFNEFGRVVFNPTGLRKNLAVFNLMSRHFTGPFVKNDEPCAGGPLIERADVLSHHNS